MHEAVHLRAWGRTRALHEAVHVRCMRPFTSLRIFLIFSYLNSVWNLRQYAFECIKYEKSSHHAFTIISKGNKLLSLWNENAINVHELFPVYGYTQWVWCRGRAEGPYRSGTRRSRELTLLVHGHTDNELLYHPLMDKLVGVFTGCCTK